MSRAKTKVSKSNATNSKGLPDYLREILDKIRAFCRQVWQVLKKLAQKLRIQLQKMRRDFLSSFASWVDPKLAPYRDNSNLDPSKISKPTKTPKQTDMAVIEEIYTPTAPESREDIFALIRETPITVLSNPERKAMSAILSLPNVQVSEIMTPASKIVFVDKDETLGPLVLDRLYRSGFTYFPVISGNRHIIGTVHTTLLNSLDIKETSTAIEIMEPRVYYIRQDYTLEQALKAFLRTNSQIMLVIDRYEKLMGMLTFAQLLAYLFDEKYQDDFDRDDDRIAVAKRKS